MAIWFVYNTYVNALLRRVTAPDCHAASTLSMYAGKSFNPAKYEPWLNVEAIEKDDIVWFYDRPGDLVVGSAKATGIIERHRHPDETSFADAITHHVEIQTRAVRPVSKSSLAKLIYADPVDAASARAWIQSNGRFSQRIYCHPLSNAASARLAAATSGR